MNKKKIISFDVGIKNLAYCIIEKENDNFKILNWNIINIMEDEINNYEKCNYNKKNKICNNKASVYVEESQNKYYFCNKSICQKDLINLYPNNKIHKIKNINLKSYSLLNISSNLIKKLHLIKDIILNVDEVLIENQPVLKNPTMKSIQMIIYGFFIDYGYNKTNINIHLFSARDKLKLYNGPQIDVSHIKNNYTKRKFLSIEYTKYYIKDSEFLDFFLNSKKKDDLADCFIQGYYYLFK